MPLGAVSVPQNLQHLKQCHKFLNPTWTVPGRFPFQGKPRPLSQIVPTSPPYTSVPRDNRIQLPRKKASISQIHQYNTNPRLSPCPIGTAPISSRVQQNNPSNPTFRPGRPWKTGQIRSREQCTPKWERVQGWILILIVEEPPDPNYMASTRLI